MGVNSLAARVALALPLLLALSATPAVARATLPVEPDLRNGQTPPNRQRSEEVVGCLTLALAEDGTPDRVEVRKKRGSAGSAYSLYFIGGWPDSPKTLAEYAGLSPLPPDMFFAGANLILEWVGGDRPVIQAFHLVRGGANLVFQKSSWGRIETWHNTILVDQSAKGADDKYHYTTTEFWQWNGKQYKLAATVPYNQRLKALAKLTHKSTTNPKSD